ncbi:hypothetical protein M569_13881 [Genlisea aurea]|uniref:Coilin N-terminal domain-containing protein n=1 Tax=Genlisea aurea TaxID=192259 RepID=S8C2B5_9LAMI|nr:hypothetical protein M569_13881 [Genlisea aurea]
MEKAKRIRVIFKDKDILSEADKLEGLKRSWILFKPQEHGTVSDVVSHLLRSFQLHDSCPDGLVLSISGFVLPSFESSCILKDDEVISVRKKKKKKEILLIEDNHVANGAGNLVAQERIRMKNPILQLENVACEKKKGKSDSDESEEVDEEILFGSITDPGTSNLDPQNRKRKTNEMLSHSKKKKKRHRETGYTDEDAPEKLENSCKDKFLVEKEVIESLEKKDSDERNVETDSEEAISADTDDEFTR